MTRKEFMAELREALGKAMDAQTANEILTDYEEFFTAGIAEGKSEAEVAQELGDPARIVLSLLDREHKPEKKESLLLYAPLGDRIIAFLVDTVLSLFPLTFLGVANALILMPFYPLSVLGYAMYTAPNRSAIIAAWLFLGYAYLYHPLCLLLLKGQTPGKRLMHLQVVEESGAAPGGLAFFLRELLGKTLIYSLTFGLGSLISFLWALFSAEHKTIPDAIAGTRVVKAKPGQ